MSHTGNKPHYLRESNPLGPSQLSPTKECLKIFIPINILNPFIESIWLWEPLAYTSKSDIDKVIEQLVRIIGKYERRGDDHLR